jgi:glucose uptake protein GlcU
VDAFYMTLFGFSLVLVWGIAIAIDGPALLNNISQMASAEPLRFWTVLGCGVLYVIGLRLTLTAMQMIGLTLTQPIYASANVLLGTLIAALVGGVPEGLSIPRLGLGVLLLLAAVAATMLAGRLRADSAAEEAVPGAKANLWKALGVLLASAALIPAYTLGLSYGLRSISHPQGLAVLPFMALLASGAFIGALLSSGLVLTRRKQWGRLFQTRPHYLLYGLLAAVAHYGGNIIHTFATARLSSVISWPLGFTSGLWTQMWGLVYGEFRGAPRWAYLWLAVGVILYALGAWLIAF